MMFDDLSVDGSRVDKRRYMLRTYLGHWPIQCLLMVWCLFLPRTCSMPTVSNMPTAWSGMPTHWVCPCGGNEPSVDMAYDDESDKPREQPVHTDTLTRLISDTRELQHAVDKLLHTYMETYFIDTEAVEIMKVEGLRAVENFTSNYTHETQHVPDIESYRTRAYECLARILVLLEQSVFDERKDFARSVSFAHNITRLHEHHRYGLQGIMCHLLQLHGRQCAWQDVRRTVQDMTLDNLQGAWRHLRDCRLLRATGAILGSLHTHFNAVMTKTTTL